MIWKKGRGVGRREGEKEGGSSRGGEGHLCAEPRRGRGHGGGTPRSSLGPGVSWGGSPCSRSPGKAEGNGHGLSHSGDPLHPACRARDGGAQ